MATRNPTTPEHQEMVVFMLVRDARCSECGTELSQGGFLRLEADSPLCLDCADLGHLEFLPSGDAALTRRASRHAKLRAVVVRWSRSRKRYERQGILVPSDAINQAEKECEADAGQRAVARERAALRRAEEDVQHQADVVARLQEMFPACPKQEIDAIAAWTCQRYSGRVGRSAGARDLEAEPLRLAVIAHIRHRHTEYDRHLMELGDRQQARSLVKAAIDQVLSRWEQGPENG